MSFALTPGCVIQGEESTVNLGRAWQGFSEEVTAQWMRGNELWKELEKEHSRQRKQQTKNPEAVRAPKPYAVN